MGRRRGDTRLLETGGKANCFKQVKKKKTDPKQINREAWRKTDMKKEPREIDTFLFLP